MKRIPLIAVLAAATLAVTACGASGSSGAATDSTAAGSSTAAADCVPAAPSSGAASSAPSSSAGSSAATADLPTAPGSVTVGSAAFPENVLLAEIYAGAMSAKGVTVKKQLSIGERGVYLAALKNNEIGFVPEYSGSILSNLDPSATAKSSDDVDAALKTAAAAQGFATTKYSPAQDSDTITVTKETADKFGLKTIGDLKDHAGEMTLGAPAQFQTRSDGVPALASIYCVTFGTFTATDAGGSTTVNALKSGSIDAADIFSTDPSIAANGFVSLEDPSNMFAAQNIVPLFSQKVLTQPMADAADAVSAKLDTKTLAGLVAKVTGDNAAQVAQEWLKSENLG